MAEPRDEDPSWLWFGSWKLNAVVGAFFTLGLIRPLTSSAPLVAIYFPGAFIVGSGWSILRYAMRWSPISQPIRTNVPVLLYLLAATSALFAAHDTTGRDIYRTAALASLWLTVPATVAALVVLIVRQRHIRARSGTDRPT